ncbi:hypothetical protein ACJIZ3_020211 [Penstemon smallii]|uniref:AMP-activated protein kinase glycogen-binding domain-containing protein n=1 Tax=Penstemon smallii TaxID=265156 RepID=A0ABD3SIP9_9LAMI
MLSLTTTVTHIPRSHYPFSHLNYPFLHCRILIHNPTRELKKALLLSPSFGVLQERKARKFEGYVNHNKYTSRCCCCCKDGDGDIELEAEIMGFMEKSEKPTVFPTKGELIKAGRMDLVEAIKRRGGWYSLGWDEEIVGEVIDFDLEEFQNCKENASCKEQHYDDSLRGPEIKYDSFSNSEDSKSFQLASSLDISLGNGADEDAGIGGILSRLEKQRNRDLGINLGKHKYETRATIKDVEYNWHFDTSKETKTRTDLGENGRVMPDFERKSILNTSNDKIRPNIEPETWRTWINHRAGSQLKEFEAAEISFDKDDKTYYDEISVTTEEHTEAWNRSEEINPNRIRTRLKHLESELTTALHSLRSKKDELLSEEVVENSSDLQKLSDAWEFQENEFISAQDRLRSIKAKLSVLDGKIALAIIDAQKVLEDKQKRIDGARKALQLLRTTLVVWPNSASEVSLAGSFDGWTTQRKMEKSRSGIFSVCLKLYPGRYEIKFIVDGIWKVDPLRPIVSNNGHENNLFIVT